MERDRGKKYNRREKGSASKEGRKKGKTREREGRME